jgi:hypothetical protein
LTKEYIFGTYLTINAENENEAIYAYDQITKNNIWISDSYCFEWQEAE